MPFRRSFFPGLALASLALALGACNMPATSQTNTVKNEQSRKAQEAANAISFTENAEIDNIRWRIELTSKPGAIGYIVLMNQAGQPIAYDVVKGKVTSGSKRLTKPTAIKRNDAGPSYAYTLDQTPSDEGTWGSSGEYIFYRTVNDEYRQWSGQYLYSDKPIRLRVEPLVISNAEK
ncbi:hypothetical protein [Methylobacterium sp. AMS5]|uniref:hypothetical protein n=1 Tax=Methylobacterium sp. AMS5 TaxID=925818 RepID=UPI00074F895D|nr:hypothetical protein [Methylobacterium sp. AMS5]AMB48347.1 hypothetical protein Y590_25600 [Methylobacterium sp. AMS5]